MMTMSKYAIVRLKCRGSLNRNLMKKVFVLCCIRVHERQHVVLLCSNKCQVFIMHDELEILNSVFNFDYVTILSAMKKKILRCQC